MSESFDVDVEEFRELVAPLVEFLQTRHDKCNPYSRIIIRRNGVAFMSDSAYFPFKVQDSDSAHRENEA